VSVSVAPGGVVGVIGESGSGKSTLVRAMLGLIPLTGGEVRWRGRPVPWGGADERAFRRAVQVVFQDPYLSLNARHAVRQILGQALWVHHGLAGLTAEARMAALLGEVGLDRDLLDRRPGALSGGQRQRVAIARALTVEPEVLVLDEPLSALDTDTAAAVLDLLERLRADRGLAYVLVSHDLGPVRRLADHVIVLRSGQTVEAGSPAVLDAPRHPYTRELVAADAWGSS
jgi:ABC-type glutathione transport system ATPase component